MTNATYQPGQRVTITDQYSAIKRGGTVISVSKTGWKVNVHIDGHRNPDGKGTAFYLKAKSTRGFCHHYGYLTADYMPPPEPRKAVPVQPETKQAAPTTFTLTISEAQRDKLVAALEVAFPNDLPDDDNWETTSASDLVSMLKDMEPGHQTTNSFLL